MAFNEDDLQVLGMSGGLWLRILEKKEKQILDRIYGNFRAGKLEHTAALAEFCSVRDQISEIRMGLNQIATNKGAQ